jgi:hypothetical protein
MDGIIDYRITSLSEDCNIMMWLDCLDFHHIYYDVVYCLAQNKSIAHLSFFRRCPKKVTKG